jgi:hypothetical protein
LLAVIGSPKFFPNQSKFGWAHSFDTVADPQGTDISNITQAEWFLCDHQDQLFTMPRVTFYKLDKNILTL